MVDVPIAGEMSLGGKIFNISGPVRVTNITVPPNAVVFGDEEKQGTTQVMAQFTQSNFLGGSGRFRGNNRTDANRAWTCDLESRYLNQVSLPSLATFVGRPNDGDVDILIAYRGIEYAVVNDKLWLMETGTYDFDDAMGGTLTTFPSVPTDAIVYKDKLYIACTTDIDIFDSTLTHTRVTQNGSFFTIWDNKLWTLGSAADGWTMYSTTDGSVWSAGAIIPYDEVPTDLFTFRDVSGSYVPAATTKTGLWLYNSDVPRWNKTEVEWPVMKDNEYGAAAKFRDGKLYTNIGDLGMVSITPGNPFTVVPMGLDQDDGVPADEVGRYVNIVADTNWVVAKVDASSPVDEEDTWIGSDPWEQEYWPIFSGTVTLRAWAGGWHVLARETVEGYGPGRALDISSAYGSRRIWFSMPDGVYYIDTEEGTYNPLSNPTRYYYGSLENALNGLVTPWWHYGTEGQDKLHGRIYVDAYDLEEDVYINVYYAKNFTDTWTLLTTLDEDGLHEIKVGGNVGVQGTWYRYRFTMHTNDGTKSPKMRFYRTDTMRLLPATWGFGVNIDLTRPCRGRTPLQQLKELKDLADPVITPLLQEFGYRDDDGNENTYYARITNISGMEVPGTKRRGEGEYFVSLTAPYRGDTSVAGAISHA